MKVIPVVNRQLINSCEDPIERALLFLAREIQNLQIANTILMEQDNQRIEQLKKLENKLKEK